MSFVLVIDDNKMASDALVDILQAVGLEAKPAYGPRAGLEILSQRKPDLVFLDMNMPGLRGDDVLAYIRRDMNLQDVPVVVVTSDDQISTRHAALAAGANKVLIKPLMMDVLMDILREFGLISE